MNLFFLDCAIGKRPSYVCRSILHGRELLKQGLLKSIGDGKYTMFWSENWLLDGVPRPPWACPGIIDLTLKVSDLINQHIGQWYEAQVRQIVDERDVSLVLNTKLSLRLRDKHIWGLSKNGLYSSQSG